MFDPIRLASLLMVISTVASPSCMEVWPQLPVIGHEPDVRKSYRTPYAFIIYKVNSVRCGKKLKQDGGFESCNLRVIMGSL